MRNCCSPYVPAISCFRWLRGNAVLHPSGMQNNLAPHSLPRDSVVRLAHNFRVARQNEAARRRTLRVR